jgi:hypothetical protein
LDKEIVATLRCDQEGAVATLKDVRFGLQFDHWPSPTEVKFTPSHNEQRITPHQLLSHEVVGADNLTPELDLAS